MANTKEIQKRMKSIRDTMKITSAMYMISSAKLRSAKQKLEQTEPYFYALQGSISRFLRHIPEVQNRYFDQKKEIPEEEKRRGYIVITADKGLAGAYNHNVIKMAHELSRRARTISCLSSASSDASILRKRVSRWMRSSSIPCRTRRYTARVSLRITSWICTREMSLTRYISSTQRWKTLFL